VTGQERWHEHSKTCHGIQYSFDQLLGNLSLLLTLAPAHMGKAPARFDGLSLAARTPASTLIGIVGLCGQHG